MNTDQLEKVFEQAGITAFVGFIRTKEGDDRVVSLGLTQLESQGAVRFINHRLDHVMGQPGAAHGQKEEIHETVRDGAEGHAAQHSDSGGSGQPGLPAGEQTG